MEGIQVVAGKMPIVVVVVVVDEGGGQSRMMDGCFTDMWAGSRSMGRVGG